jgi:hypothetical protein
MTRQISILLLLLLASPAAAQISLPDAIVQHTPIVAGCSCIVPPDAEVKFMWRLTGNGGYLLTVEDGKKAHIWAAPGSYTLDATIVWMATDKVTIDGKELRVLIEWDLQQYSKTFKVVEKEPAPPGPDPVPPGPDPAPVPTGFKAQILAAYKSINAPAGSAAKVAVVYRAVAAKAAANPNVYTPALMVDQAKNKVVTELTVAEGRAWAPFWPKMNDAFKELKLKEDDLASFIEYFTQFCDVLEKV